MPSPSGTLRTHERAQAKPVQDSARRRRRHPDSGGARRLPVRFKNRAANVYLVVGSRRTILIDVGLSTNYSHLLTCLNHVGVTPEKIDMVVLSHEHLDHIGAVHHFGGRTIAAHRLAANKIMLRDDF